MDWNWFFSTLAQSSAAIIGVIGAFIIANMTSTNEKISTSGTIINGIVNDKKKLISRLKKIKIPFYNQMVISTSPIWKDIISGKLDNMDKDGVIKYLYSDFKLYPNDDENVYKHFVSKYQSKIVSENEREDVKQLKMQRRTENPIPSESSNRDFEKIAAEFEDMRIEVDLQIGVLIENGDKLLSYQKNINFIKGVMAVLYISFFLLVFMPLCFLPVISDKSIETPGLMTASRAVLVMAFLILMFVIVFLFGKYLKNMNESIKRYLQTYENHSSYSTYSQYL